MDLLPTLRPTGSKAGPMEMASLVRMPEKAPEPELEPEPQPEPQPEIQLTGKELWQRARVKSHSLAAYKEAARENAGARGRDRFVSALLLSNMKQLPRGVLTSFRLLMPTGPSDTPSVLPESLLELLPEPLAAAATGYDADMPPEVGQAAQLIHAAERLCRALPKDTPGLGNTARAAAALHERLNHNSTHDDIIRFVLSFKNELSCKGPLIDAILAVAQTDRPRMHSILPKLESVDGADAREMLSTLRLGDLQQRALALGVPKAEVKRMLGLGKATRQGYGKAADERDAATLVQCPHPFFRELRLQELHAASERESSAQGRQRIAWREFVSKVARVQHQHGPVLWRKLRERLELVGETAHFLYGDHGVDLKQAYASTDEASVSLEYSELEEAQLAEEEAEKARCFLHPNKRFRSIWDLSILLLLLYVVSGHRTFHSHDSPDQRPCRADRRC